MKRNYYYFFVIVILGIAVTYGTFFLFRKENISAQPKETGTANVAINGITLTAEVADTEEKRAHGLSGRDALPQERAMLFVFEKPGYYTIWMKDMRFPIDIIWVRDGRIVDFISGAPPPQNGTRYEQLPIFTPEAPADFVVETYAGFIKDHSVAKGTPVFIELEGKKIGPKEANPEDNRNAAGSEFFIETLQKNLGEGKNFTIARELEKTDAYTKYLIFYYSDDLKISGVMNVPLVTPPKNGFPVLILNHGLIRKEIYFSGRGSKREQDFFARHGYATIHPDYRGLGESDANPAERHDFYVGYLLDVARLVDAVKTSHLSFLDANRIGMWGHSMGGGIAARVMVLRPEIRAYVLFAPISADAEDNFYELSQEEIAWLHATYGPAGSDTYKKISPLNYFSDVSSPVQLHHGTADKDVPIAFSERMFSMLTALGKRAEFYVYPGEKHEFIAAWPIAAERALHILEKDKSTGTPPPSAVAKSYGFRGEKISWRFLVKKNFS